VDVDTYRTVRRGGKRYRGKLVKTAQVDGQFDHGLGAVVFTPDEALALAPSQNTYYYMISDTTDYLVYRGAIVQ